MNDVFDEKLLYLLMLSHRPADIARATVRLLSELVAEADCQGGHRCHSMTESDALRGNGPKGAGDRHG